MDSIWWLVMAFIAGVNFGVIFMAMLQLTSRRKKEEARRQRAQHGTPLEGPSVF
jgi:hypothetical protein